MPLLASIVLGACQAAEEMDARADALSSPPAAASAADTTPDGRKTVVRGTDGFDFMLHRVPEGQVDSVFVTRAGQRVQVLVPSTLQVGTILDDPTYRIDMDFDGHLDFALMTLLPAGPNESYDFWRYDPAAGRFRYVGEYPRLEPDSAARRLGVHQRGGYAGRAWSNSRWRWEDDRLVEFWRSGQGPLDPSAERWVYSESELRGGRWVVVKADTLENCEAEPLPEECQDEPAPAPASGVQAPPRP